MKIFFVEFNPDQWRNKSNTGKSAVKNLLMPLGKVLLVTGSIFTSSHLLDNVVNKKVSTDSRTYLSDD